ncbi:MAG: SPFH domain-containing protein [Candidatus Lutacidiplasmatales archaeon]
MVDSAVLVTATGAIVIVGFTFIVLLVRSAKHVQPYQQGVLMLFGSYRRLINPGLNFVSPLAVVRLVDLRSRTMPLAPQEQLTSDGVVARIEAALEFKVVDAAKAICQVDDYAKAAPALAERVLCQTVAQRPYSAVQFNAAELGAAVRDAMSPTAAGWGVQVLSVDIKRVGSAGEVGTPGGGAGPLSISNLRSG